MKKLYAVVIFFVLVVIGTAVWFSPLCAIGDPVEYKNNAPIQTVGGVCYSADSTYRVDFEGGESELYAALKKIYAEEVKRVVFDDGLILVYAFSPRVATGALTTSDGKAYNVMAASNSGRVSIGAPVLEGSY